MPRRPSLLRSIPSLCLSLALLGACSNELELAPDASAAVVPGSDGAVDLASLAELDRAALVALAVQDARVGLADHARRAAIVERLRVDGPAGLDALIADYRRQAALSPEADAAWRALIDAVAAQRDAVYGGLFWRKDMAEALAEAARSGKPVLSLRLLGDLGSEYSCANSRMFRTLLYADPELARWLEASFVLHWSSERPVPRVEIDFGDGRVVERTITGNSAHFVLDAEGRTLDVIPGLWSSPSFQAALADSLALHAELAALDGASWREVLAAHHEAAFSEAATRMRDELSRARLAPQDLRAVRAWLASPPGTGAAVPAVDAVAMAVSKSRIEQPILDAAPRELGGRAPARPNALPAALPSSFAPVEELERRIIGARLAGSVELHPNSLAIIAAERPLEGLVPAGELDAAEARLVDTLRGSIQLDTAKNALELYPRVHAELAARVRDGRPLDFAEVDAWVYAELFQTPASDPWLGLVDPAIYTGLERGGLARR